MNRAIKFRGKIRREGGREDDWVYGGVFLGKGAFSIIYPYEPINKFPVYTDTVGQFTGIKDIMGREIFEGDIVQREIFGSKVIGQIVWMDIGGTGFYMKAIDGFRISFYPIGRGQSDDDGGKCNDVILGNIYDNPELLN